MDDSKNQAGNARLLNMPGRRDQMLRTMLLCALTAAIFFLPFYIIDGGFFHYAGDFNSQQISFYRYMNGFIKGAGYPDGMAGAARSTFSWATDLGSGAMNAYSFYLYGSPFFWLSLIFPQNWLPYLMVPLLVLKFAVAGGGAYRYLCRYVRRSDHAVLGACLYAFSGFSIYNVFFNHFIDVVALFPWMLWALDETLYEQEEHYGLFAFWVGVNLLNNYFFFIGQVLFLVIYFICKLTTKDFPMNVRLFVRLAFESLLGAALGFVLLWPAVLSILQNPRTIDLSSGWGFLTYSKVQQYLAILLSWILPPDSPYMTSIWSEGIIKWTSMSAYLPLCSLAGAMAYWRARKGDSKKRIVATCAIFALVPVLNSAFYALNSSYYARWYKSRCTGFLNARRAPLKKTENILVFYQKLPLYNPQFEQGKPYKKIAGNRGDSTNYGKFIRSGSGSEDGLRFPGNVLAFPTVQRTVHPTQKPVALSEYFIKTYTRPGEVVADICAGSGTTAVAALNTGRRFVCFETAPAFYGPATERIRRAREAVASGGKGE